MGVVLATLFPAFVWWVAGDTFHLGVDEGIYIEGGRRIAAGQTVYRDFFALTGPLTFWIEGAFASWFGADIPALRLPMILDVAFLAVAVYWLAARFEGLWFSAGLSLVFLVFECRLNRLVVNHRWDSAALATAAALAAFEGQRRGHRWLWVAAGGLAAGAAWATPSMAWAGLALLIWARRRNIPALAAGGLAVAGAGAAYLASHQALAPMIAAMRWTAANYARANELPYGAVHLAAGASKAFIPLEAWPAMVPVAAMVGWGWRLWRRRDAAEVHAVGPLLGVVAALVVSAWPRWSSEQLLFVAAIPFALCAVLLHRLIPARWRFGIYGAVLLTAASGGALKIAGATARSEFQTRAGVLSGTPEDAEYMEQFERHIQAGDSLFVFPYLPILYPLLDADNPTRFLYLQPGMMTEDDEQEAIAEVEEGRPRWVVIADIPEATILDAWPASDRSRIPMAGMHAYLRAHYRTVDRVGGKWGPMEILDRQ